MKTARLKMVLAMTSFGTIGLFVRHIPLPSQVIATVRALLASGLLALLLLAPRHRQSLRAMSRRELPLLLLSGAAMGFNWILLFEAYRYTTVSIATLSYYFAPVIVMALCPLLFREKMTGKQVLCFVMSTLGLVLITGTGDLSAGSSHLTGILFGLGAACLYASVILINKRIRSVDGLPRTLMQFLAASAVLTPYTLLTGTFRLDGMDAVGWCCLIIVGLVHTGLTYCLYFSALGHLPGSTAAILSYVDPLVAVTLSVTLLHEAITPLQLLGGALMLGFTLWSELPTRKRQSP